MKPLLNHLTKFVSTVIDLYSPLPIQLSSDLHTLNAYLRTYTQTDQMMLEGFVNRLAQKLEQKLKSRCQGIQIKDLKVQEYDHMLKHHNSCTMKVADFKLDLPTQMSENSFVNSSSLQKDNNKPLSYRSNREKSKDGIKSNRHKFGTRDKNKTVKMMERQDNKENIQTNYLNYDQLEKQDFQKQRYLKYIKSEAQLSTPVTHINIMRNGSTEAKREDNAGRNKGRYQSKENRTPNNMAQLKIKLKPKSNVDFAKLLEGIDALTNEMKSNSEFLNNLMDQMRKNAQQSNGLQVQQQRND